MRQLLVAQMPDFILGRPSYDTRDRREIRVQNLAGVARSLNHR